jgi:uncharacterized membrane protein
VSSFFKEENTGTGGEARDGEDVGGLDDALKSGGREKFDNDRAVLAAILSYIPFLCLIPLLQMRDIEEARFHSRQGFILFLIELLALFFLIPGLSGLFWKAILIFALGASVAGIIFGIQGKLYRLPIIGDYAERLKI